MRIWAVQPVYLLHPPEQHWPGIEDWVADVKSTMAADPGWSGWRLIPITFDRDASFKVADVSALVLGSPGPVVLVDQVQAKCRELLRQRLRLRCVLCMVQPMDSTDIWAQILVARTLHEKGEPYLPRKYVAAVLLIRKLYKLKVWGGAGNKNFLWLSDLHKGRGVPPDLADVIPEVANDLYQRGMLLAKYGQRKGKRKRQKYALNSDRLQDIEAVAAEGTFADTRLLQILMKDHCEVPQSLMKWEDSIPPRPTAKPSG